MYAIYIVKREQCRKGKLIPKNFEEGSVNDISLQCQLKSVMRIFAIFKLSITLFGQNCIEEEGC